jgi:aspartyl-tRNA(Asn)/glutamyl-tRNA(Gln) amidotransferase subunit C
MAEDLDLSRIRHVATLAELALTADEEQRFAKELGAVLAQFAELDAIDTTDVAPTTHIAGIEATRSGEGWREDAIGPCLTREEALRGAPHTEHDGFAVPTFVE